MRRASPDTLTIEQAAARLGVGRGTAYRAARLGQLPVLRIGGRLVVPRAALERLLRDGALSRAEEPAEGAGHG